MKRIQVTVWQSPEEVIETARGPMPFGIWVELERWRFTRAGHRATIIGRPDRRIALFRLPVRQRGPAAARPPQVKESAESFPCAARFVKKGWRPTSPPAGRVVTRHRSS